MKLKNTLIFLFCLLSGLLHAQHQISMEATLQPASNSIAITQQIVYQNTSNIVLNEIYLNDWANSFSEKTTPLARRFSENYDSSFHFEKNEDRGKTTLKTVVDETNTPLQWERGNALDILKITLNKSLQPNESYVFICTYTVKLPNDKFTRYGVTSQKDFNLRYWYLSPAVFDGEWHAYSNKNTEDLYLTPSTFYITFHTPARYSLTSDLDLISEHTSEGIKTTILQGDHRSRATMYLEQRATFETIETDKVAIVTNLQDKKISPPIRALVIDRIAHFLDDKLGEYPFEKIVISEVDYKSNPVYGLNQLPNFISPFPDGFEYDMEQLKTISRNYIENTLHLHPRNDYWLSGALQIYLMMQYVDTYYPKMKIIGNLSDFWIIKWAHGAELEFNDQYPLLYLNMARNNLHQKLTLPKDSLLKFNKNIANSYYGGQGLKYLSDYLGEDVLSKSILQFYAENKLKPSTSAAFQKTIEQNTSSPVHWFFEDYVDSRTTIDFKIKKIKKQGDSLRVQIRNRNENSLPVPLYGINNKEIVSKKWIPPFIDTTSVTIAAADIRKLVLNYEHVIPEYNLRNNYKKVKGFLNRPLQFRILQDIEDPNYNQLFFMPIFEYNLYDGISAGLKLYNKTVLPKGVHYKFEPQFGFRSKNLIGSGSLVYNHRIDSDNLYSMRYGFAGSYYSYDENLFYKKFTPFITFSFRENDLRNNKKQFINIKNVNVYRDEDPLKPNQEPNYSVFNVQYVFSNPNLINYFRGVADYQISSKFSKLFTTLEYRKLFNNNRQLNVRLFAGVFLFNDTGNSEHFFDFALDRPTDYLFEYGYYGRSEDQGLFSQQYIVSEGGFKSQLEPAFSDSWMTTLNASTNIWRWIYAYGDVGLVHNKGVGTKAVFDSGIRVNLVADYFELYFPIYSSLGFEPNLPHYDERVRFTVTLSPKTLLGLFTREWY